MISGETSPAYSNCPLGLLYLWLRGFACRVVATRAPMSYFPWHMGAVTSDGRVFHFKRTSDGQPFAPFWFEGRMQHTTLTALLNTGKVLWVLPAWFVAPLLIVLVAAGLPIWMTVGACYWPYWLMRDSWRALRKRRVR